jgi:hypothetical protein
VENKERSGKPSLLTLRDTVTRKLYGVVKSDGKRQLREVTNIFNEHRARPVSDRTVQRKLYETKYQVCRFFDIVVANSDAHTWYFVSYNFLWTVRSDTGRALCSLKILVTSRSWRFPSDFTTLIDWLMFYVNFSNISAIFVALFTIFIGFEMAPKTCSTVFFWEECNCCFAQSRIERTDNSTGNRTPAVNSILCLKCFKQGGTINQSINVDDPELPVTF